MISWKRLGVVSTFGCLVLLSTACGKVDREEREEGAEGTPRLECPPDFVEREGGRGCAAVRPPASCPAGEAAFVGETDCVAVGFFDCPSGFEADPEGWGCKAVLPAEPCTGTTGSRLGSRGCVPAGDCGAPFPPAEATLFVDPNLSDHELGPTRFQRISDALNAAPEGAVIAIESGTYAEALRLQRSVTLIGRCPDEVKVTRAPFPNRDRPGIHASAGGTYLARGLHLLGHVAGVSVDGRATLRLEDVVVEDAIGIGLASRESGSVLEAEGVTVRNVVPEGSGLSIGLVALEGGSAILRAAEIDEASLISAAAYEDSEVILEDVVLRGDPVASVYVESNATLTARGLAVAGRPDMGLLAIGGSIELENADLDMGEGSMASHGVMIEGGATAVIRGARIAGATEVGVLVEEAGTEALLENVTIRGVGAGPSSGIAMGIASSGSASTTVRSANIGDVEGFALIAELEATLELEDVRAANAWSFGSTEFLGGALIAQYGAKATGRRLSVESSGPLGILVSGTHGDAAALASFENVLIRDVRPSGGWVGGGAASQQGGRLELSDCAIEEVVGMGALGKYNPRDHPEPGFVKLSDCSVVGVYSDGAEPAMGVGGAMVELDGTTIWGVEGPAFFTRVSPREVRVRRSFIGGSLPDPAYGFDIAVYVDEGGDLLLEDSYVVDSGIALAARMGGRVGLERCTFEGNETAIQAQQGSFVRESAKVPSSRDEGEVAVDQATTFEDNDVIIGTGTVPLPDMPLDF